MRWSFLHAVLPLLVAALLAAGQATTAQGPPSTSLIAVRVGSPRASADEIDARIAAMLASGELTRISSRQDPLDRDRTHEYFAQRHRGVPILGAGVSRQRVRGQTVSAFGTLHAGIALPVPPGLGAVDASVALQRVSGGVTFAPGSGASLAVLRLLDGTFRLTYQATFADGQTRFVDADTGELVLSEDAVVTQGQRAIGTGIGSLGDEKKISTVASGDGYQARDRFRPGEIVTRSTEGTNASLFGVLAGAGTIGVDSDNTWTNPALVDAHVHAGWVYDYFHERHGWAGLDGENSQIDQVVVDRATLQDNAFFFRPSAGNVGVIAFGVSRANISMATLDVVGHELMHGVTFFSVRRRTGSGLLSLLSFDGTAPEAAFQGQTFRCDATTFTLFDGSRASTICQNGEFVLASNPAGAINEGFSDVFGAAVEFRYQPGGVGPIRADYLIGEDLAAGAPTNAGGLLRSLSDPTSIPFDPDFDPAGVVRYPDHYDRRLRYVVVAQGDFLTLASWTIVNGQFVAVATDNGGVHANATLMGHVYYLAVEGGTNRTSGLSVPGVGFGNREQIEKVFFRAMNLLMPPDATFPIAGQALRQAAIDLYGSSSAVFRAVDGALLAVGL